MVILGIWVMYIHVNHYSLPVCVVFRVGQKHVYTVYLQYYWQRFHEIYSHIRCIYAYSSGQP